MSDTIAAIATGNQISAIGIVRLSGPESIDLINKVFCPHSGKQLSEYPDRQLIHGQLRDSKGRILDDCLCTISHGPNSYTGENTAEIQCHGSPTVLRLVLEVLFALGARQALPGEFTKRAFVNGRLDLTQAEAVIDLIDSETEASALNAAGQLGGAICRKTDLIYDKLVDIISHYDAVIDYPDEDIDDFELSSYCKSISEGREELSRLLSTFERGRVMKSGVRAAIVGKPNAGKSSLLNCLLGYDRAIVTNVPGTTRDTIEEKLSLGGVLIRLTDTAGLRGTDDPVERLGVDRSLAAAGNSELIFAVFDGSCELSPEDEETIEAARKARFPIAIINKADLPQKLDTAAIEKNFGTICFVSARNGTGIDRLSKAVKELFPLPESPAGEILTNSRQADAVRKSVEALNQAYDAITDGITPDVVLTQVENAIEALGQLTGRRMQEDVVQKIFNRFCVGK